VEFSTAGAAEEEEARDGSAELEDLALVDVE